MRFLSTVTVLGLCLAFTACTGREAPETIQRIRQLTSTSAAPFVERSRRGTRSWQHVRDFYAVRDYAPAWIVGSRPTPSLDALLDALAHADRHGLDPTNYGTALLVAERQSASEHWFGARFDQE